MGSRNNNSKDDRILTINDIEGNIKFEFGEPFLVDNAKSSWVANYPHITVDEENNIYLAFVNQNRIEKYSANGVLLLKISRKLPYALEYNYGKENMEIRGTGPRDKQRDISSRFQWDRYRWPRADLGAHF